MVSFGRFYNVELSKFLGMHDLNCIDEPLPYSVLENIVVVVCEEYQVLMKKLLYSNCWLVDVH